MNYMGQEAGCLRLIENITGFMSLMWVEEYVMWGRLGVIVFVVSSLQEQFLFWRTMLQ